MASIANSTILVTGANRGIGRALVEEALDRGAARVYAGTRRPTDFADARVVPVTLDVTDPTQIADVVEQVGELDLLVNNAGIAIYDDLGDPAVIQQHLAVNLFGPYAVTMAFLPALVRSGGAVVTNLSVNALAPLPIIPAYSISKAAAFSFTQSLRALTAGRGVTVHAVLTGPVDTDMTAGLDIPKASAASVARAVLDGVDKGEEDIFPDPLSAAVGAGWHDGPVMTLQRRYAQLAPAQEAGR